MNCIWLVVFQISIYFIICIDTQRSWWTDEFDDSNFLASEQKSMHQHRHHHHQLTRQSVRRKFMADEAHSDGVRSAHDRENGNVDSAFRHKKTATKIGNHQANKNHNARRGQRQKHNKNGNRTRQDRDSILDSLISLSILYFIYTAIYFCSQSIRSLFCTRRVWTSAFFDDFSPVFCFFFLFSRSCFAHCFAS